MSLFSTRLTSLLFIAGVLASASVHADVRLPRLLSDGVVLQRDKPVVIWGWADEGEELKVQFAGQSKSVVAKDGRWQVRFKPLAAGGSYRLAINAKNHLEVNNITMGDVWIAAGQSNMELPVSRLQHRYDDIVNATNTTAIREFSVPTTYALKAPLEDFTQGQWQHANPTNIPKYSAVGFFFARKINEKNHVPVGLITLPVGGSPAEAWMSEEALKAYPHYLNVAQTFKDEAYVKSVIDGDKAATEAWYAKAGEEDIGSQQHWETGADAAGWQSVQLPDFFKNQKVDFTNGVIWLRKTLELTAAQAQQGATLWLGAIIDGDEVYLNGKLVGKTGYQYPPRIYDVPAGSLVAGKNTLVVRLTSYSGNPGFMPDKTYALKLNDQSVPLAGEWQYKLGMRAGDFPKTTTLHYQPASLFNAKLSPVLPMPVAGVIWYQGESNAGRALEYQTLFPDLITDWRKQFHNPKLPFLFVQLANFMAPQAQPTESGWAQLREAQRNTLDLPNTAMAVAIDLGEWNDIHPLNKKDVGERLALAAQRLVYRDKKVVASGPSYASMQRKDNRLILSFTDIGSGLTLGRNGGELQEFAIAGEDNKYVWAQAKIVGNQVEVWSEKVANPKAVRYAWADNPASANLYNAEGLPASPFQATLTAP